LHFDQFDDALYAVAFSGVIFFLFCFFFVLCWRFFMSRRSQRIATQRRNAASWFLNCPKGVIHLVVKHLDSWEDVASTRASCTALRDAVDCTIPSTYSNTRTASRTVCSECVERMHTVECVCKHVDSNVRAGGVYCTACKDPHNTHKDPLVVNCSHYWSGDDASPCFDKCIQENKVHGSGTYNANNPSQGAPMYPKLTLVRADNNEMWPEDSALFLGKRGESGANFRTFSRWRQAARLRWFVTSPSFEINIHVPLSLMHGLHQALKQESYTHTPRHPHFATVGADQIRAMLPLMVLDPVYTLVHFASLVRLTTSAATETPEALVDQAQAEADGNLNPSPNNDRGDPRVVRVLGSLANNSNSLSHSGHRTCPPYKVSENYEYILGVMRDFGYRYDYGRVLRHFRRVPYFSARHVAMIEDPRGVPITLSRTGCSAISLQIYLAFSVRRQALTRWFMKGLVNGERAVNCASEMDGSVISFALQVLRVGGGPSLVVGISPRTVMHTASFVSAVPHADLNANHTSPTPTVVVHHCLNELCTFRGQTAVAAINAIMRCDDGICKCAVCRLQRGVCAGRAQAQRPPRWMERAIMPAKWT
jgi:hypothetical protein